MRAKFVENLITLYNEKPFIFLTGDLGYNMFEPLQELMGERFINAGIAEQNMVGMAAGMAKSGEEVWVYSIAPFLYARAFEQIRNDICFNNLPVKLCGMGGGYHYGDLGPSHWALEDYGTLMTLPNIKCYIPAFVDDLEPIMRRMRVNNNPTWLRLGRCEKPEGFTLPRYSPARIISTVKPVEDPAFFLNLRIVTAGTIAGTILKNWPHTVIIVSELDYFKESNTHCELVIEEHVKQGGINSLVKSKNSLHATSFTDGPYGSQQYMRERAGLTIENIMAAFND